MAEGIKIANPKLKVVVFAGDGGTYNEGISHLIHAAKRNIDLTVLVHDNRCFALTTGQFTATSPQGFKGKSTPQGSFEEPLDPLQLMLSAKASFIARGYSGKIEHLQKIILAALRHPGFSFVNILQPCVSFFNTTNFYNQRVYEMKDHDSSSFSKALSKMQEGSYQENEKKIPLGIFLQVKRPLY